MRSTNNMEDYYVTQKAFNELKRDLEEIQTQKKWEIAELLKKTSSQKNIL